MEIVELMALTEFLSKLKWLIKETDLHRQLYSKTCRDFLWSWFGILVYLLCCFSEQLQKSMADVDEPKKDYYTVRSEYLTSE